LRRSPRALDHLRVRFDADYAIGALGPNAGRKPGARTEVDDEARPLGLGDQRQDVEELARRREAIAVVEIGEVLALVARALDQGAREIAHSSKQTCCPTYRSVGSDRRPAPCSCRSRKLPSYRRSR